mgnify:FL=1
MAELVEDFKTYIAAHKDEITALRIFYNQPYQRRSLTFAMIKDVLELLKNDRPALAPMRVWQAYEQLEAVSGSPRNELIALISLLRRVTGIDKTLTAFDKTVDKNFQDWVFKKHSGSGTKFNEEQMSWLRMIKEFISTSFHMEKEDFALDPFNHEGGLGKMWQLFGETTDTLLQELNEALAA